MILDATCHISFSAASPIPAIMMPRPRSGYALWITREEYAFALTSNYGALQLNSMKVTVQPTPAGGNHQSA